MKPAPGRYRLTWTNGTNTYVTELTVTEEDTIPGPWGTMVYEAAGDAFRVGLIAVRCTGAGTFVAINDSAVPPQSYTGTCVLLA